jgi:hypothetical protein
LQFLGKLTFGKLTFQKFTFSPSMTIEKINVYKTYRRNDNLQISVKEIILDQMNLDETREDKMTVLKSV